MKKSFSWMAVAFMAVSAAASASVSGNDVALKFNPDQYSEQTLAMPDGKTVKYRAYEHLYFVTNVEDSVYQYLNFYVPEAAASDQRIPILLRTYVGGYMASQAQAPSATDASGRALEEGYAVCIPGSRGRQSQVEADGKTKFTGRAPAAILDLKAAIRYLRYNDKLMPGDAAKIITDGTSAGGAMSSLMGATGNHPMYEPYLKEMGAAPARDDVFASVCYCPIIDLDHADMAYEWLYGCTNTGIRQLNEKQQKVSEELAAQFPDYINSLHLQKNDGTPITSDNYQEYMKSFLLQSFQKARNEGCNIPDSLGISFYEEKNEMPPQMGRVPAAAQRKISSNPAFGPRMAMFRRGPSEFVTDVDLTKYLNYVVSTISLKTPPAFDQLNVIIKNASPENEEFGDEKGSAVNFTDYSLRKATGNGKALISEAQKQRIYMMNPMNFIGDSYSATAKYWYIRHGARDRDTAFPVPINLATKLQNNGCDVNFALPWNRPHSGDYNLDDLFEWIRTIIR